MVALFSAARILEVWFACSFSCRSGAKSQYNRPVVERDAQNEWFGFGSWSYPMRAMIRILRSLHRDTEGSVFVEYLLLLTIVGIGVIAGLATVRGALLNELIELAKAIAAISP
jgi:pilus assembly protein Flp/PilA